jgi:hypothetical protein
VKWEGHLITVLKLGYIYLSVCPSICLSVCSCCSFSEHRAFVTSLVSLQLPKLIQSVGLLGRGISPTQDRCLNRTTQTQNKRRETSTPWVGFEPSLPVFERAKTFHALDHCDRQKIRVISKRQLSQHSTGFLPVDHHNDGRPIVIILNLLLNIVFTI